MNTVKLFIFLLSFIYIQSQNFGEINSYWIYNLHSMDSDDYIEYRVVKDTVVNDTPSKKVKKTFISYIGEPGNLYRIEDEIMGYDLWYHQNGSVYRWVENQSKLLFHLNPSIGEFWPIEISEEFPCQSNSIELFDNINVLSENTEITFEGVVNYKEIESENGDLTLGSRLYENIGPNFSPYPVPAENCDYIDNNLGMPSQLICYNNGLNFHISFNQFEIPTVCSEQLSTLEQNIKNSRKYKAFPNPASNYLYFNHTIEKLELFTRQGIHLGDYYNVDKISTENLSKGIYLIRLNGKETLKFVKD